MENRIFKYALLISLLAHVLVLTKLSYSNTSSLKRILKNVEVTYFKLKPHMKREQALLAKKEESKTDLDTRTEVRLKESTKASSFIKDISKLFNKFELPKKKPAKVAKLHSKRLISVPPIKSEKINNPIYLNYYQIVRGKIKEKAYANYARLDIGEVYLTFAISSDGALKQIKLIEERTSASQYLKKISLKSVQDANPFPPFPRDLRYPELTFNVVISFKEIED